MSDSGNDSNDSVFTNGVSDYTLGAGIENTTMQWRLNGLILSNFGNIYGATATGYTSTLKLTGNALNNTLTIDSGYYFTAQMTKSGISSPAAGGIITVGGSDITISNDPIKIDSSSAIIGSTADGNITVGGSGTHISNDPIKIVGSIGGVGLSLAYGTATLNGGAGDDTLVGSDGNDVLNGGSGNDTLQGGAGSDTYIIDSTDDVITEMKLGSEEDGLDTVISVISITTLPDAIENAALMDVNMALTLSGNASANILKGNSFNNILEGNEGNDRLYGNAGNDFLNGGTGDDNLCGGMGNDILNGGAGYDIANYSQVTSNVTVNLSLTTAQNTVSVGMDTFADIERVDGGSGNDTLTGNSLDNALLGGLGNDTLNGGIGNDNLSGGEGNDILNGGAGNDALYGDSGNDTFVLSNKGNAFDYISRFSINHDKIQLRQFGLGNIGDGDTLIEGGIVRTATAGFAKSAELVVFKSPINHSIHDVDDWIGNAASAYAIGDQRVFVMSNDVTSSTNIGVYLFTSANADAVVSNAELKLLALVSIDTTAPITLGNFLFA